jgi:hypothetical protein
VHDAVLIEAPLEDLNKALAATQQIMGDVSELVLGDGYRIGTDFSVTRYPDVYVDEDAGDLYHVVMQAAREADRAKSDQLPLPAIPLNGFCPYEISNEV